VILLSIVGELILNRPVIFPPLIVRFEDPNPSIEMLPVISLIIIGEDSIILPFRRLESNVIVSSPGLFAANAIASRREPMPSFAVVVTSNGLVVLARIISPEAVILFEPWVNV
jgi:hypothetical protein